MSRLSTGPSNPANNGDHWSCATSYDAILERRPCVELAGVSVNEPPTKSVSPYRVREVTGPLSPPPESVVRAPFLNTTMLLAPGVLRLNVPPRKIAPEGW